MTALLPFDPKTYLDPFIRRLRYTDVVRECARASWSAVFGRAWTEADAEHVRGNTVAADAMRIERAAYHRLADAVRDLRELDVRTPAIARMLRELKLPKVDAPDKPWASPLDPFLLDWDRGRLLRDAAGAWRHATTRELAWLALASDVWPIDEALDVNGIVTRTESAIRGRRRALGTGRGWGAEETRGRGPTRHTNRTER